MSERCLSQRAFYMSQICLSQRAFYMSQRLRRHEAAVSKEEESDIIYYR